MAELRSALAAAAEKVDQLEEKEKDTAAAHKKEARCRLCSLAVLIACSTGCYHTLSLTLAVRWSRSKTRATQQALSHRCRSVAPAALCIVAAFPHEKLFLLTPPCAGADERERAASVGHAADGEGAERRARRSRGTQLSPFLV